MSGIQHVGPVGDLPAAKVVEAAQFVKEGRCYSLATSRFPGMPLFPGHPPFQVLNYRTPPGIRAGELQPWGPPNEAGLGYMAEYVMATSHSGAHVDALGQQCSLDVTRDLQLTVHPLLHDVFLLRRGDSERH